MLTVGCLLVSCQMFENEPKKSVAEKLDEVRERRDLYCKLSKEKILETGSVTRCDGLLFTSLHAVGCDYPSIEPFEGEPGQWFRSPGHDCFIPPSTDNGSDSTISKDMYAGLLLYIAKEKRGDMAINTLEYCKRNMVAGGLGCQVGKAIDATTELSKTVLPVTTVQLLEDMKAKYQDGRSVDHATDTGSSSPLSGFQGHLQVLRELTKCMVYGGVSDRGLQLLKNQAERQPNNALYSAAYHLYLDGDMNHAADLLLSKFPSDRLPTTDDFCSDYIYQRDEGTDWEPCVMMPDGPETHTGTDLIFAASVILGELRP